jgi:hypothetical protein
VFLAVKDVRVFDRAFVVRLDKLGFYFDLVAFMCDDHRLIHVGRQTEATRAIHGPGATEVWFSCCEGKQRECHNRRDCQQCLSCHRRFSF